MKSTAMKSLVASLAFAAAVTGPALRAQAMPPHAGMPAMPEPSADSPAVVQTQANPRGSDAPAVDYPAPATAGSPVPPALPADPAYRAGPYKGALTAPPPEAFNKVYPVCTRTLRDSCRNRGGV